MCHQGTKRDEYMRILRIDDGDREKRMMKVGVRTRVASGDVEVCSFREGIL